MYNDSYLLSTQFKKTFTLTLCFALLGAMFFFLLEPNIGQAITSQFTVRQQITSEIAFLATSTNVTMAGSVAGITGGTATGSTYTVVQTNSSGGYNMTIQFSSNPAMTGDLGGTGIKNFGTSSLPVLNFVASTSALFGFTVTASTTSDIAQPFLNNAGLCNQTFGSGGTQSTSSPSCWMNPTSTAYTIINRNAATLPTSTSTIVFKVVVPSNPSPAVASDFYTATATLTAVTQ
jgi:hypothetical protein